MQAKNGTMLLIFCLKDGDVCDCCYASWKEWLHFSNVKLLLVSNGLLGCK